MGYAILKDVEKGIAALIDPDAGRALGPIVVHDEGAEPAADLLESFVGGLGIDPATMTPHKLDLYWERFLDTIHDIVRTVDDVARVGDEVDGALNPTPEPPAAPQAPPEVALKAQETSELVTPGPLDTTPEPDDVPTDVVAASPAAPPTGEPVVPTGVPCTTCDGFGTYAPDGKQVVECPTCKGSGQMPAEATA